MFKAVRLNTLTYPVDDEERTQLANAGAQFVEIEGQEPQDILAAAEDCDALLVVSSRVPAAVIGRLSRCRVIARLGAGTDRIDIVAATRQGIVVTNVPDFCLNEQAEHTLTLLLAFARRLPYMMQAMHAHQWSARHHPDVHRMAGQTLGLVGFGASAQAVAQRTAAFGMRLLAWVRQPGKYQEIARKLHVELQPLDRLLSESDFVSIHLPLCDETRHLVSAERLARLKPTAVLINTARGAIIDERALVELLRQRRIGGAALDVFEGIDVFAVPGTPASHPLLELDNVLLTPHCAGSSVESSRDSKIRGACNAADVLRGVLPRFVVNADVQPRFPLQANG
jgi:D-3-phosphoglycerate dehydrogenase